MTATQDLSEYTDKKVVVTYNTTDKDGAKTTVELECTVEVGNASGLLVKPKGKVGLELIEAADIENVVLQTSSDKMKPKKIQPVRLGQARSHLLERHGATLTEVNGLTEEQAFNAHEGIDHEAADLGHVHVEKKAAETAAAADPAAA